MVGRFGSFRTSCCAVVALLLGLGHGGLAASLGDRTKGSDSGPYCGLYCVHGALKAIGKDIPFEFLLRPRYLGSREGSTIGELQRAVTESRARGVALSGLGAESLRSARDPMILHVARDGQLRRYNHWVLFCGMEGGRARIVDAPNPVRLIKLSDVLARWNGTARIVSGNDPPDLAREGGFYLTHLVLALGFVLACSVAMARRVPTLASGRLVSGLAQAAAVTIMALILAIGVHILDDTGFLRNPDSARYVAAANVASFFPKVGVDAARRFVRERKGVVVDARFPDSFARGTIPGAVNVPIDTTPTERLTRLGKIGKRMPLLVFCQSSTCQYDETIATLLAGDGFENITLFPGGYRDWTADERD